MTAATNDRHGLLAFSTFLIWFPLGIGSPFVAWSVTLNDASATIVGAICVMISSLWSTWMLSRVHTLVNSNFNEAKAAREAAEASLKTSQEFNKLLKSQLAAKIETPVAITLVQPAAAPVSVESK